MAVAVALPRSQQGLNSKPIVSPTDIILVEGETSDGRDYYQVHQVQPKESNNFYNDYNDYDDYGDYSAGYANAPSPMNGFF